MTSGSRFKKYARHVQRTIREDDTLVDSSYSWCLREVQAIWDEVWAAVSELEGTRTDNMKQELVRRIKPKALKLGDND